MKIGTNNFCKRQVPNSNYSHFGFLNFDGWKDSYWTILEQAVTDSWDSRQEVPGRPGVVKVTFNERTPVGNMVLQFFSGVQNVTSETVLETDLFKRNENEAPYLRTLAVGSKSLAVKTDVFVYSQDALAVRDKEGKIVRTDATTNCDYEIITINSRVTEEEPPTPISMARNFLNLPGGSPANYSAEEFAKAIVYWSTRCMTK